MLSSIEVPFKRPDFNLRLTLFQRHFALFLGPDSVELRVAVDYAAGDDGGDGRTAQSPAAEGCVAATGFRARGVERPDEVRVEERHVGACAFAECPALRKVEDARRVD